MGRSRQEEEVCGKEGHARGDRQDETVESGNGKRCGLLEKSGKTKDEEEQTKTDKTEPATTTNIGDFSIGERLFKVGQQRSTIANCSSCSSSSSPSSSRTCSPSFPSFFLSSPVSSAVTKIDLRFAQSVSDGTG